MKMECNITLGGKIVKYSFMNEQHNFNRKITFPLQQQRRHENGRLSLLNRNDMKMKKNNLLEKLSFSAERWEI